METKKYQIMLAVDEFGSFTRVGEELGYSQPGITQMMKSLEKEIGFPLFIKHKHGISLTKEAQALLPSIRTLITSSETINQEIASLKGAQKGTIIIGTYLSCSMNWIPKIIKEFHKAYPGIRFKMIEAFENDLPIWIQEHKIDIGFLSYQPNQPYLFLNVMEDPFYAVLPADHPYLKYHEIPIELFETTPVVMMDYNSGSEIYKIFKKHKVRPDIHYNTINEFSVLSMVEHGLGISILPGLILRGQTGNFEVRPITPQISRQLGIAYASADDLSPAAGIFLQYARDFLVD